MGIAPQPNVVGVAGGQEVRLIDKTLQPCSAGPNKGGPPIMNAYEIQKFKLYFEEQKTLLDKERERSRQNLALERDELTDEVDLVTREMQRNLEIRLRGREHHYLKKIDLALQKIREGAFGVCESCNNAIELKRLEARPTCTLCIHCKEEEEKSESNFKGPLRVVS